MKESSRIDFEQGARQPEGAIALDPALGLEKKQRMRIEVTAGRATGGAGGGPAIERRLAVETTVQRPW